MRLAIVGMASVSFLLAIVTQPSDKGTVYFLGLLPGGLLPLACALDRRLLLTNREYGRWIVTACIAMLWSLTIEHAFGSAEMILFWRGYPYRWLIASAHQFVYQPGMPLSWSIFLPGLLVDFIYWVNVAGLIFVPLRILRAVQEARSG